MLDRVRLGLITVTQTTGTRRGKSGPKSQFMWALGTDAQLEADHGQMAEGVGFEPTVGYQPTTVFKTAALSRSAIPPALLTRFFQRAYVPQFVRSAALLSSRKRSAMLVSYREAGAALGRARALVFPASIAV